MFAASKSGSVDAKDAQFPYVTMLLHGDGTNGAQNNTFLDSSTNAFSITRNGNTTQGTFTPYGSNWSNYLNGTSDTLDVPTSANNSVGTGSFCFEAYIFMQDSSAQQFLVANASSGGLWIGFNIDAANKLAIGRVATAIDNEVSYTWTNGTWYHVAVNRNGTSLQFFVNGTQVGSTGTNSVNYPSQGYRIGSETTQKYFKGYISNFRLVRASVYTTTFTPSTTPLTAITSTAILTCQSNRFIDNSTNAFALTANGSPSVQRFSPFSPTTAYSTSVIGGSGYFDGSGDSISAPDSAAFNMTGTSYCFETWIYPTTSAEMSIFSRCSGTGLPGLSIQKLSNGQILFSTNDDYSTSSGTTVLANTWSHIACTYDGSTKRVFLNGALMGSTSSSWSEVATAMTIGDRPSDSRHFYMVGYVSNSRIVKGSAVYTSAFTPPTAPLSAISGTSLLLSTTNAGILDNAMMNDLETVGNAQISTSVKKYGTGSMYFDGSGDWLASTASTDLYAFGTGAFTIEFWLYLNTTTGTQIVYDCRPSGTNGTQPIIFVDSGVLKFQHSNTVRITGATLSTVTWYHIALARSGTDTKLFVNGTQSGSTYTSDSTSYSCGSGRPIIGTDAAGVGSNNLNGYIDDLRITKGVARYTATFTPSTTAFPDKG